MLQYNIFELLIHSLSFCLIARYRREMKKVILNHVPFDNSNTTRMLGGLLHLISVASIFKHNKVWSRNKIKFLTSMLQNMNDTWLRKQEVVLLIGCFVGNIYTSSLTTRNKIVCFVLDAKNSQEIDISYHLLIMNPIICYLFFLFFTQKYKACNSFCVNNYYS